MGLQVNIASFKAWTYANGPGLRAAIWVQGCTRRCPGCFNPETHPHEARRLVDPQSLVERLLADDEVEGLTILGGEPFEQAEACAVMAETAHELGRSVMVYSGYEHEALADSEHPDILRLLAATDLICCGPFIRGQLTDGRGWRGSLNQRLIRLSERIEFDVRMLTDEPLIELSVSGDQLTWTGQVRNADLSWIKRVVRVGEPIIKSRAR